MYIFCRYAFWIASDDRRRRYFWVRRGLAHSSRCGRPWELVGGVCLEMTRVTGDCRFLHPVQRR
jgi:hypothetical protein